MNDSILQTIKKLLGIHEEYEAFDQDIIVHINTVLNILSQMGVGKKDFFITGSSESWTDYTEDRRNIEMVKSYIYLKVKKQFDPSNNGTINTAYEEMIKELEWRLYVEEDK